MIDFAPLEDYNTGWDSALNYKTAPEVTLDLAHSAGHHCNIETADVPVPALMMSSRHRKYLEDFGPLVVLSVGLC